MLCRAFRMKNIILLLFISIVMTITAGCANHQTQENTAVGQRFNDIEFWVKMFEDPERDAWQKPDDVVKALQVRPGDIVADIGAGTGYFTRRLAVAVGSEGKAIGLDIEQSMVDHMKEEANKLNLSNYDARVVKTDDPELVPESVDMVFLCNTYHHIGDRVEYFKKAAKGLKSGGRLVIVDFYNKENPVGPPPDHTLAKSVVMKELKEAGFKHLKTHDLLPHQYFLEFRAEQQL